MSDAEKQEAGLASAHPQRPSIGLAKECKTLTDCFCNAVGDGSERLCSKCTCNIGILYTPAEYICCAHTVFLIHLILDL